MSRSNRRNTQQWSGDTQTMQQPQPQQNSSGGQGIKGLPYGSLTINLGKKGLTISGASIQPVTVPLQRQQQPQPQYNQQQTRKQRQVAGQFPSGGQGNISGVITACLLAAQTQGQINAQQFALHQQALSANQQLLTSLTAIATQMGMPMTATPSQKQRKQFRSPQQQVNQQQGQSRKQKQQQFAYA